MPGDLLLSALCFPHLSWFVPVKLRTRRKCDVRKGDENHVWGETWCQTLFCVLELEKIHFISLRKGQPSASWPRIFAFHAVLKKKKNGYAWDIHACHVRPRWDTQKRVCLGEVPEISNVLQPEVLFVFSALSKVVILISGCRFKNESVCWMDLEVYQEKATHSVRVVTTDAQQTFPNVTEYRLWGSVSHLVRLDIFLCPGCVKHMKASCDVCISMFRRFYSQWICSAFVIFLTHPKRSGRLEGEGLWVRTHSESGQVAGSCSLQFFRLQALNLAMWSFARGWVGSQI